MLSNINDYIELPKKRFKVKFIFDFYFDIIKLICKTIILRAYTVLCVWLYIKLFHTFYIKQLTSFLISKL